MPRKPLTRDQSREVDRLAIEEFGFPGIVLMENAGRGCVEVMERVGVRGPVVILAGKGNNAGDGFVIARHLAIEGYEVKVALATEPAELTGDAMTAFKMMLPCRVTVLDQGGVYAGEMINELDSLGDGADWIVDALLGTGAVGRPRPPLDALIDWINAERETAPTKRVLALDVPSGLDCDTGQPAAPTVRADHTCTFVAPKVGFSEPAAAEFLGEVHTVSIGVPRAVVDRG